MLATLFVFKCVIFGIVSAREVIRICDDYDTFQVVRTVHLPNVVEVQSEKEIGAQAHFSGLTPSLYRLNITFQNYASYSGSVDIHANVTKATKRLMVNVEANSPMLEYDSITVQAESSEDFPVDNCIRKVIIVEFLQLLVIELTDELPSNTFCTITFPQFSSTIFDDTTGRGAAGLRWSGKENFQTVFTQFQNRNARSVFPCMDHPALKAQFRLCASYPKSFQFISNMPVHHSRNSTSSGGLLEACFETTPAMSTYAMAFVMTESYVRRTSKDFKVILWTPAGRTERAAWILDAASYFMEFMYATTGILDHIPKLQVVIHYPLGIDSMNNWGLIGLDGQIMENNPGRYGKAADLLYHEIAHQWVGDLMTVKYWGETCLQEGLAVYLTWYYGEKSTPGSIERKARLAMNEYSGHSNSLIDRSVSQSNGIIPDCYSVAPLIFYSIGMRFGLKFAEPFLQYMMNKYAYANAGIDEWDSGLAATQIPWPKGVNDYLKSWLTNPSPITIRISIENAGVTMEQDDNGDPSPRLVFAKMFCSKQKHSTGVVVERVTYQEFSPTPSWCLLDPDALTFSYQIYDIATYKNVLEMYPDDKFHHLTPERQKRLASSFCYNLLHNQFESANHVEKWDFLYIFVSVEKFIHDDLDCICCVIAPSRRNDTCKTVAAKYSHLSVLEKIFSYSTG